MRQLLFLFRKLLLAFNAIIYPFLEVQDFIGGATY